MFIKKANLANFAGDNTMYAASKDITSLLEILKFASEEAIKWFENNHMFVKSDNCQAIVVHYNKNINENYTLSGHYTIHLTEFNFLKSTSCAM